MFIGHGAVALRMGAAVILGGLIGLEREYTGRPAGLRTHLIVSIASATFMLVSTQFVYFQQYVAGDFVEVDASRIAASVVSGIGFLGAGAILRSGGGVQGLTTAASLWLAAAIGLAAGGGMFLQALLATLFALFCLTVLRRIEGSKGRRVVRRIAITFGTGSLSAGDILEKLRSQGAAVTALEYDRRLQSSKTRVLVDVSFKSEPEFEAFFESLESLSGAIRIKVQHPG